MGLCVALSEECHRRPGGKDLVFTAKSKSYHKKRRGMISIVTLWTPAFELNTAKLSTRTAPDFFCALYDRDKRKKLRLRVVPDTPVTPRRYQVILEDEDP